MTHGEVTEIASGKGTTKDVDDNDNGDLILEHIPAFSAHIS
jgi:hypothetical protein